MTATQRLPAFKAYDIRGRLPEQLNPFMVHCIGRAYARIIRPQGPVAVGRDIRESSPELSRALIAGLNAEGVAVVDIGLCGTEMVYFAAARPGMGGGIMVTASHNPADYNGLKMVRAESRPVSSDTGLQAIEAETLALMAQLDTRDLPAPQAGLLREENILDAYVSLLLSRIDVSALRPLHVVVNAGNGCAGPVFDALAARLPIRVTRIHHEPDGRFPNGVPNPMLAEQQAVTRAAVLAAGADLGLAWDGDFDRCFFFDGHGDFIEGYYLVGLLAEQLLKRHPGEAVVHDPRLTWNTLSRVAAHGGRPVVSKCGHSFIKDRMREANAVYGGEMSAHHYFRDFFYCDSGMLPWLLVLEQISGGGQSLADIVRHYQAEFPCSGEINFTIANAPAVLERLQQHYAPLAIHTDYLDGLTMEFADWRFNLRSSNTEPVVRLNIETRGDLALLAGKTAELTAMIRG